VCAPAPHLPMMRSCSGAYSALPSLSKNLLARVGAVRKLRGLTWVLALDVGQLGGTGHSRV
jgi:hypothetical protein